MAEQTDSLPSSNETPENRNDDAKDEQQISKELSAEEAYFATLNEWVKRANISQNAMMFPWYLMSSYPQLFAKPIADFSKMPGLNSQMPINSAQNNPTPSNPLNANNANMNAPIRGFNGLGLRILNDQSQAEMINRTGGYEYVVAPYWKRALAEVIDIIIMLVFKIGIIYVATNIFGHTFLNDMYKNVFNKTMDGEDFVGAFLYSMDMFEYSSDLLALAIAAKLLACVYEALLTRYFNGATLGKRVMGLSIKYVEAVVLLPVNGVPLQHGLSVHFAIQAGRVQLCALLYPAKTPSFIRSFARALAKNIDLNLLFPLFMVMVFYKKNSTGHDFFTKTMVVENSSQSLILRRPNQQ